MNLVHGVDVSYWEPRVDWRKLREQSFRFALIRATSGIGFVDSKFRGFWESARAEGILRGAYHYLIADQDPLQQANLFISTVGADKGELPPIVDLEDKYNENASNAKIIDTCKKVLDRIEQAFGRKPMIYSRTQYLNVHVSQNGKAPSWAKDYPLWVAQYPYVFSANTMPNANMPTQAAGWQDWKFWQYSESAIIDGVTNDSGGPTGCDLDWFRGTLEELYQFANVTPATPIYYTAQNGDTFQTVAGRYKVSVEELLNANPNLIKPGTVLTIPVPTIVPPNNGTGGGGSGGGTGGTTSPVTTVRTHTVAAGEVLGTIAAKYKVTVAAILAINPEITNPNFIYLGQVIVIP